MAPAPEALPRVLVLTTGGTIASRSGAPSLPGEELVDAVPQLREHARVRVEEVFRIGSSAMTPERWIELGRRVQDALSADTAWAGVVITHGTDTIEETAYFLHLTLATARPVVLTGAMRSATALSADGPANLRDAVRTAAAPQARGRGVLVVLNGEIHSARTVRKMDNLRLDAFRSPGPGALGVVDPDGVVFYRIPERRHTRGSAFAGTVEGSALPRVPLVADFTGAPGAAIRFWRERGVDGLVVAAFGGGRTSPGFTEEAGATAAAGIPVVLASRVPGGRVTPGERRGLIAAGDLPPWKARILLSLALLRTRDPGEIQELFRTH